MIKGTLRYGFFKNFLVNIKNLVENERDFNVLYINRIESISYKVSSQSGVLLDFI